MKPDKCIICPIARGDTDGHGHDERYISSIAGVRDIEQKPSWNESQI